MLPAQQRAQPQQYCRYGLVGPVAVTGRLSRIARTVGLLELSRSVKAALSNLY